MILTNDEAMAKKINSAIFPGIQGGPLMHVIAAKAVAFGEALKPEFKTYAAQVVANAQAMADACKSGGLDVVSGGTDTHLALIDLRPKKVTGRDAEHALERAFITCNKNGVPFDPEKPTITSGIRVGSPAGTTRGFGEQEFTQIGDWIGEVVGAVAAGESTAVEDKVRAEVKALTAQFPIYNGLGA
jgi:glycine hydroxymethyltransferase